MTRMIYSATVALMLVCMVCLSPIHADTPSPDVLAGYHFAGLARWLNEPGGTRLKEILALPQTQALGRHVLDKLAHAPHALFPQAIDDTQATNGIPLIEPLLEDWIQHESFLEVRGPTGATPGWIFGIAIPAERGVLWRKNLTDLMALWKLGTPATAEKDGMLITTVRNGSNPMLVRWCQFGDWLMLGVGIEPLGPWDKALAAMRQSQRPCLALTDEGLIAELNLARLAGSLGLPGNIAWPHATVNAAGRDEDIRLGARLFFSESATGPLEPWHVPTNIIQEPLISFTAWRGARPWLNRLEILPRLGISPAPNEVYFWAQSMSIPQTLLAFPAEDPTNRVRAMLDPCLELIPAAWRKRGLGQLEWRDADQQLVWKALPLLFPHLRGGDDGGRGFITGGTFPALHTTNPPPRELLNQFVGKPDLIYYDWELTARRLVQLRMQAQLSTLITGKSILGTNTPPLPWLMEMEQHPGNSATEVIAVSPREWTLTRKSPVGLTATELMGLMCWVESLDFPRFTFRFPDVVAPKLAPTSKSRPVPKRQP